MTLDEVSNEDLKISYLQWIEVFPSMFTPIYRASLFEHLINEVQWNKILTSSDTGVAVPIKRRMAYLSDRPTDYHYAKLVFPGQSWVPKAESLKNSLNETFGFHFNSVLLNLYENGKDEIRWHSDKEDQLGEDPIIGCFNLGATRKFWFLDKDTGNKVFYEVADGDFLIMKKGCQKKFLHAILPEKEITEPRLSMTFRQVFRSGKILIDELKQTHYDVVEYLKKREYDDLRDYIQVIIDAETDDYKLVNKLQTIMMLTAQITGVDEVVEIHTSMSRIFEVRMSNLKKS